MAELWDLYDKNRKLLGRTLERGKQFEEGEYYVAVEMWTINSNNQLLVTQRHPNKKAGKLWEFSGGGVAAGESTIKAAKRELQEELGFDIKEDELSFFTTYLYRNCFMDIYLSRKDIDINALTLQSEEVVDAKWVTIDEFEEMCNAGVVVRSVSTRFSEYKELLINSVKVNILI